MAIVNGYCTLAELKARLSISDTVDDTVLEAVAEAASRGIDNYCDRRFYAAAETRYYTADTPTAVTVDDLLTVTTLATDDGGARTYTTTWAATDYDLSPNNAALRGRPYTSIAVTAKPVKWFPTHSRGVKIVGSFGYASTTPDVVNEACLLWAARLFRRKDSPLGVAGFGELGVVRVTAIDADVKALLGPLRKFGIG